MIIFQRFFMLHKVCENTWSEFLNEVSPSSSTQISEFLEVGARCSKKKIVYFIWCNKEGSGVIGFAALEKYQALTQPIYNLYHHFLISEKRNEMELAEDFYLLFKELRSKYSYIRLKLSPTFKFFESLLRAQVPIRVKKTYIKSLNNLTYSRNLHRIINRSITKNYNLIKSDEKGPGFREILNHNRKFWSFQKSKLNSSLLEFLLTSGFTEVYELWDSNKLTGAIYVFRDDAQKQIQTMFLSKRLNGDDEAHTLLYHLVMEGYYKRGFSSCDFLGANIPEIAHYKSKFKGDLVAYCEVELYGSVFYKFLKALKDAIAD